MIANTAFDIEKGSPAECNRACTIPFPVPVSHVMCEICAWHSNRIKLPRLFTRDEQKTQVTSLELLPCGNISYP
jgi:hypothetical protein